MSDTPTRDAKLVQFVQYRKSTVAVFHNCAFGDLKFEVARVQATEREDVLDLLSQCRMH